MNVTGADGRPIKFINIRLAAGHEGSDAAFDDRFTDSGGNTAFPGALLVSIQHEGGSEADSIGIRGCTLHVNVREVNARYQSATVFVAPLPGSVIGSLKDPLNDPAAIPIAIVLPLAGGQPPEPPPGTNGPQRVVITHNIDAPPTPQSAEARAAYDEWKGGYFAEANRLGITTNNPANRERMIPWCKLNGCKFQNQDRGDTRARIFLPPNPDGFTHTVNLGDDPGFGSPPAPAAGGPLKWEVVGQT